ncbi:aminoglycoside phosphotransferase family protein [Saccharothrix sp. BKS2]|uniref:aminoglycoside phosphotransferase family protein n=1 Tax=Saccharothrix sp. BKS2 TaxID=3064400 RepID=UPI0039E94581
MHDDQLTVTAATVRALVADQFPGWRDLPVRDVAAHGTVNAIFRVGDGLTARFPLRPGDPGEVRRELVAEADAARELLGRTPFRTPEPVALGGPGAGYPLPWSVQTWLPGAPATPDSAAGSVPFARDLAAFVRGVRAIDTRGRVFRGRGRGGELRSHDEYLESCFRRSEHLLDVPRLRGLWADLRSLPRGDAPDVMTHGDLIPGNVLVAGGRLTGVIDVGGLGPADPALDLVGAWHLLDAGPRRVLREELGCGDDEWARGRGWAFQQAMGLVWYYAASNPVMSGLGRRTLARLVEEEGEPGAPEPGQQHGARSSGDAERIG